MKNNKEFTDEIHGFKVRAISKVAAWMIIRNKCHELNIKVPTIDKIKIIKNNKN